MEERANETMADETLKANEEPELTEVIDTEPKEASESVESAEELQNEVTRLSKEKEDAQARVLRVQAEFDNFKKRSQREKEADLKYKSQDLVNELLPAMDNFERAMQVEVTEATAGLVEGITMVYNQLKAALKSQGVEEIEAVGKMFDPNLHNGVM